VCPATVHEMRFGVLGPITAWTGDGQPVPIPGAKVRALLADLVVHVGEPVTTDRLVDDLWGESPDSTDRAGLVSSKVSQLRRALEAAEPGARSLVVSPPPGYTLAVEPGWVDADEFTTLVDAAAAAGDPREAADRLERALALWRGPAYGEVADMAFARSTVSLLDERRLTAYEALARARLALGEHARVADEMTPLVAAHPWREELRLAQVLALYRAGRQPDALASFEDYRRHLLDELGIDPSPAAAALQHAVLVQDPSLDAPAPAAGAGAPGATPGPADRSDRPLRRRPSNLPGRRTAVFGRDDDVAALVEAIDAAQLVTLVGPGGVGKTTLALEAARHVAGDRPDGAWFVDLSGIDRGRASATADVVADEVTAVLAIRQITDTPSSAPSVDRLGAALRGHEALLVLDNCEHVVEAAAAVADRLLRDAPDVTVLATSREPLGVPGEVVRTVAPLAVPAPRDQRHPAIVAQSDAVRLFVARARAAGATTEIEPWTAPLLGTLCRRLDGLPLALELAATRVPALGLSEVVGRLGDRFRLLGAGRRGGPERHRTLEAMLDWSWDLLDEDERVVLRRLAVHADGCTLAAAAAVGADGSDSSPAGGAPAPVGDASEVADVLGRLVERSLVVANDGPAGTRYRLFESVSAYATARLVEAGERDAVRRRHLAWHLALAERADAHLRGPHQAAWLGTLDVEGANMHAALDTAVDLGLPDDAHRLVAALGWYWTLRGRTGVALRAFDCALALAPAVETVAHARAACLRQAAALTQGETADHAARSAGALAHFGGLDAPVDRGRSVIVLGMASIDVGLVADGEPLLDQALRVAVAHGDRWAEAAALLGLALPAHMHGDPDQLRDVASRSEALFVEIGDPWGRLAAGQWLGALAELEGDLDTAEKVLAAGLDEAERLGLWRNVASRLGLLGWIAHQREDWTAAQGLGEQALRLAVEQADRSLEVLAVMVLAFAARQHGDLATAEAHLRALLDGSGVDPDALASGQGAEGELAPHVVTVLAELGFVTELGGDPVRALALHRAVLDASVASDYRRDVAESLEGGAAALAALGEHEAAARALGAAAAVRDEAQLTTAAAEQRDVDRALAAVVAARGRETAERLLAEGRGMDPREALSGPSDGGVPRQ
jgi:predicted ATPase/DNA-binding SARP family transcriptional activator